MAGALRRRSAPTALDGQTTKGLTKHDEDDGALGEEAEKVREAIQGEMGEGRDEEYDEEHEEKEPPKWIKESLLQSDPGLQGLGGGPHRLREAWRRALTSRAVRRQQEGRAHLQALQLIREEQRGSSRTPVRRCEPSPCTPPSLEGSSVMAHHL